MYVKVYVCVYVYMYLCIFVGRGGPREKSLSESKTLMGVGVMQSMGLIRCSPARSFSGPGEGATREMNISVPDSDEGLGHAVTHFPFGFHPFSWIPIGF